MNNIYLEHLSADERDNLIEESILDNEYRRAEMMYNIVEMQEEQMMREAELKVLAESGTYNDLVLLYEAAQTEAAEKKQGILEGIFAWFAKLFQKISNFFGNIKTKVPEQELDKEVQLDEEENNLIAIASEAFSVSDELFNALGNGASPDLGKCLTLSGKLKNLLSKKSTKAVAGTAAAGVAAAGAYTVYKKRDLIAKMDICEKLTNSLSKVINTIQNSDLYKKLKEKYDQKKANRVVKKNAKNANKQNANNSQQNNSSQVPATTQNSQPATTQQNTNTNNNGNTNGTPTTASVNDVLYGISMLTEADNISQVPATTQNSQPATTQQNTNNNSAAADNNDENFIDKILRHLKNAVSILCNLINKITGKIMKPSIQGNENNGSGSNTNDQTNNDQDQNDRTTASDNDPNPKQKRRTRKEYDKNEKPAEIVNDGGVERSRLEAIKPDGSHGQKIGSGYKDMTWFALRTNGQLYYFDGGANKFKIVPDNGVTVWNQNKTQSKVIKPDKQILDYVNKNIINKKSTYNRESVDDVAMEASVALGNSYNVYPRTIKNIDFICIEQRIPDDNIDRYKSIFGVDYSKEVQESVTNNDIELLSNLLSSL